MVHGRQLQMVWGFMLDMAYLVTRLIESSLRARDLWVVAHKSNSIKNHRPGFAQDDDIDRRFIWSCWRFVSNII